MIFEESKQTLEEISEIVKSKNSVLEKNTIKPLIDQSNVLQDFVTTILKEEQEGKDVESTKEHFSNFKKGIFRFILGFQKLLLIFSPSRGKMHH